MNTANKIYVGNLPFNSTESDVRKKFEEFGEILDVALIKDTETGRPKGFCFIEFTDDGAAERALTMDKQEFDGRLLRVNKAKPKQPVDSGRYAN